MPGRVTQRRSSPSLLAGDVLMLAADGPCPQRGRIEPDFDRLEVAVGEPADGLDLGSWRMLADHVSRLGDDCGGHEYSTLGEAHPVSRVTQAWWCWLLVLAAATMAPVSYRITGQSRPKPSRRSGLVERSSGPLNEPTQANDFSDGTTCKSVRLRMSSAPVRPCPRGESRSCGAARRGSPTWP